MVHPYLRGARTPRVLAHRGLVTPDAAAAGVVDNSFAAVAAAHAAGVEFVESDCHLTADGVVVLLHDDDLSRIAGDPRRVADLRLHELADLLADRGGLLTLEQALDAFPEVRFNLDVKADGAEEAVGRLVAPHAERVLLTSFSDERRLAALAAAERAGAPILPATSPGSRTLGRLLAALTVRSRRATDTALRGLDALQIPERHRRLRVLTPRLLDAAHAHDVEVHVWTVNDPEDMRRLRRAGVDGLVTDRADVALALSA
ncbi:MULTISPECIES: glycerophosphodiester phosphodiesterase family protein [Microbacterium]|uniref:Glycerophosphodiester phosphodiesterase n=1 Tax=Microbacterium wangchenii TaxID=2541726 RepID=A0ABX5SV16_9MICO|nr:MULTISPECIES: glycerophosphodiester phosphodiesterase family protein [Microbacterium]MCK6065207.1 glycerophosphodiester phosphodiesterase [Microbacterium sp. EYE_512]QBR88659.1 glycerophosphodiester phosphodiesterase [Microbacterium wangchenii]TFV82286.1 glycerophosphodiester phosphodiesterase [Microbacterium sp. dk485]TXK20383.1 glycerophosphodiester phosphodiesterase [Microbacterium wangchenii]